MNYKFLEKAIQFGLLWGILKILIEIINMFFLTDFLLSHWFPKIFLLITIVILYILINRNIHFQKIRSRQKLVAIFIMLQLSSVLVGGFEIFIHHSFDKQYKNKIAQRLVERQKSIDEKFEKKNNAIIENKDESYDSEMTKIVENYSMNNMLNRIYFAVIGNIFLMVVIYFLTNISLNKYAEIEK
ncbi:hypothetical protein VR479_11210 [Aquirufa aurantiipilula]